MKVFVIATAVCCSIFGAAQAQTNVVLYGVADGNLRFDHTNIGTLKSVGGGGESGSRWGLRGTEDLGGGLKATFNFEQGIDLSDNAVAQGNVGAGSALGAGSLGGANSSPHSSTGGRLFSRVSTVGLAGSFGEVRFGRYYNPIFIVQYVADPFGAGMVASPQTNVFVNDTVRNENAIYYDTPRIAALQFSGVYQFGESTTTNTTPIAGGQAKRGNDRFGAGITYLDGPIYAGVGYEHQKSNFDNYRIRTLDIAGTYDFTVVKLHAIYWQTKNDNSNVNPAFGSTNNLKFHSYFAGVTVPFGAFDFMADYGRIRDTSTSNIGVNLGNPRANFLGVGTRYSLSKRTVLYAAYARNDLKTGPCGNTYQGFGGIADSSNSGLYNTGNLFGAPTACVASATSPPAVIAPSNVNPYSYQFGIRHSF